MDSRDIRKHRNDVFRLFAVVDPEYKAAPAESIQADMREFMARLKEEVVDFKNLGLSGMTLESALHALGLAYLDKV